VLTDRYIDSTLAYQGYGCGLPVGELRRLNEFATGGLWPRLTLLFDVPAELGLERSSRAKARPDRMDRRGLDFHRRVAEGYRRLAAAEPARFKVIDARLDVAEAHGIVVSTMETLLRGGGEC
jgi:dTMP kinase